MLACFVVEFARGYNIKYLHIKLSDMLINKIDRVTDTIVTLLTQIMLVILQQSSLSLSSLVSRASLSNGAARPAYE